MLLIMIFCGELLAFLQVLILVLLKDAQSDFLFLAFLKGLLETVFYLFLGCLSKSK